MTLSIKSRPEPKSLEEARSPSTVEDESLFNLIPDALLIVDKNGTIRKVNDQFMGMFDYGREELLGQPVEALLPERLRQRHVNNRENFQVKPALRSMGAGLELWACRKDGSEFPVDIMLSPLPSSDGRILAVVRDITQSKQAQEELRRLAFSDTLTGLPNRAALYNDLEHYTSSASAGLPIVSAVHVPSALRLRAGLTRRTAGGFGAAVRAQMSSLGIPG